MDYQRKYDTVVVVYEFLVVTYLLVSFATVSGGGVRGLLFLVACLAAGYFVVRFWVNRLDRKRKKSDQEKRCRLSPLVSAIVLTFVYFVEADEYMGGGFWPDGLSTVLIFGLLIVCFGAFLYAQYYREKYLTMYVNSCISEEAVRRFEQNTCLALKKTGIVAGIFMILVMAVLISVPTTNVEQQTPPPGRSMITPKASKTTDVEEKRKRRFEQINEKEKEERSPFLEFLLYLLRRICEVVGILLAVIGIAALVYAVLRRLLAARLPARREEEPDREKVIRGNDEYIVLRPKQRSGRPEFSRDHNGRIRRYFYRFIWKRSGGVVDMSLTPWELVGEDRELSDETKEAVRAYEKARYSGRMCGDEEVLAARKGFFG